jgi:hypothetical protein
VQPFDDNQRGQMARPAQAGVGPMPPPNQGEAKLVLASMDRAPRLILCLRGNNFFVPSMEQHI